MSGSAALLSLLTTQADVNYYTQQLTYWSNMYDANAAKLAKYQDYEDKWYEKYDDALHNEKEITFGSVTIKKDNRDTKAAEKYAYYKVKHRDQVTYDELTDLDMKYGTIKAVLEAQIQADQATVDSLKPLVTQDVQETYLLGQ